MLWLPFAHFRLTESSKNKVSEKGLVKNGSKRISGAISCMVRVMLFSWTASIQVAP